MQGKSNSEASLIEALKRCARAAESLDSFSGLTLAGRLYVKAWELEHGPAPDEDDPDDTALLEWAAATRARLAGED